jgi:DNA primase
MAAPFSQALLDQIRAANDIVDVIGAVVPLKRAGANFLALCPFHKEKTPSFNVNPQRQIFHCFGCQKGGDVFTFVKDYEGVGFSEAVRRLAERVRIPLEHAQDETQRRGQFVKETLLQIHEAVTQRWQTALANEAGGQAARDYLQQRGVTSEAIRLFRLGYAPDLWDDTVNWARGKGYDPALVEQAGLVVRKAETGRCYDRFRGRLMFPICDEQGRVIGFSGRLLSGDAKAAKYINSPETPIFTKGRVFFGIDKARRALLDQGVAVLCEGQLDLIACYMAGVQNVVAPQGTAFTPDHARLLKRYVNEVILCFDADVAGQAAAIRVQESLLASGLAIRVMTLPPPHDPDSYIKEFGGEAFRERLGQAREFFDFYLDHLCATLEPGTDKGQNAVVRAMAELLQKAGDAVLLDKHAQKTAMKLSGYLHLPLSPDAVRAQFQKLGSRPRAEAQPLPEPQAEGAPVTRPSALEFWLLKLLLLDHELLDWAVANLDLGWIQHPWTRGILLARFQAHRAGRHDAASLLTELEEPGARNLISEALAGQREIPNRPQQLIDVTRRLRDQHLDRESRVLLQRSAQPELSDAERLELLRRHEAIRQLKRQPTAPLDPSNAGLAS